MDPALPVSSTLESASAIAHVVESTPVQREVTRTVSKAVRELNDVDYAGQGREITFSIDRNTRLPVVKVVSTSTQEVLDQWPAEYVLQLAAEYVKSVRNPR